MATQGAPNIVLDDDAGEQRLRLGDHRGARAQQWRRGSEITSYSLVANALNAFRIMDPITPLTLAPNATATVRIMFTPSAAGGLAQSATLVFASNDPTDNSIQVEGTRQPPLTVASSTRLDAEGGGSGTFGKQLTATVSPASRAARSVWSNCDCALQPSSSRQPAESRCLDRMQ